MIKTIMGKFEKGKIIPISKIKNPSEYKIYITLIPLKKGKHQEPREKDFLAMAHKADTLFKKKKLKEVRSLKELD